jgi:PAS domain S-box-containing protein
LLATKTLQESEERFRALIENSAEMLSLLDRKGNIFYAGPSIFKFTGYNPEEYINKSKLSFVHPEDREKVKKALTSILLQEHASEQLEYRIRHRQGGWRWIEGTLTNLLNLKSVNAVVSNFRDITERRLADEMIRQQNIELQKTNSELDLFVYSASHDLRAPLTSLLGLIHLSKSETDNPLLLEYFKWMTDSVNRLDRFIRDIIHYSRNSRLLLQSTRIDFEGMFKDALEDLKYLKPDKKIFKEISVRGEDPFYTDRSRLKVVISNLLSNALRYHDYNKDTLQISMLVECDNDKAIIVLSDNGRGIEEKYIDRIFDMFFRASLTNTGSGLGLYIVKETIAKLNGRISVESTPGLGTAFTIEIPNLPLLSTDYEYSIQFEIN